MTLELKSRQRCFKGEQRVYAHPSRILRCEMKFAVYVPDAAAEQTPKVIYYLSGLTCTEQNVITKAGAQRICSELGILFVCPDTSPRGSEVADDAASDLGQGAGFYVDATAAPWSAHYKMESYVTDELYGLVAREFGKTPQVGIMGHSMGGHGALTLGLRHPELYKSASAFSPICAPSECPWGQKAFEAYLGSDRAHWLEHDACALISRARAPELPLKVDQGANDEFLEVQLRPERLKAACERAGRSLELNLHQGYDHSYYFIATFMESHLRFHERSFGTGNT